MNLKEQQYICVLADCANISRAAEKLYISQPALSIYINNLEKSLGVKLFDRSGKKFIPTPAGEIYVEKARKMLKLQEEFESELNDLRNHTAGSIVCGVQLRRAPLLLPPVMARFRAEYPNIRIILKEGVRADLERFLSDSKVHLVIDNLEDIRDDHVARPLYVDYPLLALPDGHPLAKKAVKRDDFPYPYLDLAECRNEFFILPTARRSLRFYIDKVFADYHMASVNHMEVRNFETIMQLVAEGYGIGFNRQQYAQSMKYTKPVRYFSFGRDQSGNTRVYAVYPKGRTVPDYMERFIELLEERGRELGNIM